MVTLPLRSVWVTLNSSDTPLASASQTTTVPALRGIFFGHVTVVMGRSGYDGATVAATCFANRLLLSSPAVAAPARAGATSIAPTPAMVAMINPTPRITGSRVGRRWIRSGVAGGELERGRVHAVPLAGGARSVVEDVTEVAPAATAADLGAHHAVGRVGHELHRLRDERLGEARPAGTGLELGVGVEQLSAARRAAVDAVVV